MVAIRKALPQPGGALHLTDSGLETDLIFHHGVDLPHFAAFPLLGREAGRALLAHYYDEHARLAVDAGLPMILETPTWRASPDWAELLGYDAAALRSVNRDAVDTLLDVRARHPEAALVISGCIGPRADAYQAGTVTADEARGYHTAQVEAFASTDCDVVSALTLTSVDEAVGVVQAAVEADLPVVVSFTVETDGRLPDGTSLDDAVQQTDARTDGAAQYFMVNCAHPDHVEPALASAGPSRQRLVGVRANASRASHAELDDAESLDEGDALELGAGLTDLRRRYPALSVLGGCCGTDVRHVRAIAALAAGA